MAGIILTFPIVAGKVEAWRRFCQELSGSRRQMYESSRQRLGITWATFPHMYMNFYVFQYATGISGANAFARRIRRGDPGAAEAYLGFLKSGGSMYPLDSLRQAGLDLSTPAPVEETFEILSGLVDRLEGLTA